MRRRTFLGALAAGVLAVRAARAAAPGPTRLAAAWRGPDPAAQQFVGLLDVDWAARALAVVAAQPVPGRAHGIVALDDGFAAMAYRFGRWLWRFDGAGRVVRRVDLGAEPGGRRASGHLVPAAGGRVLLAAELDPASGAGWVAVRDATTLAKLDEWPTHGADPHQLVVDPDGRVLVANGGVLRTPEDRKRDLAAMASSLVALDGRNGTLQGRWTLDDARLSLRHLALGPAAAGARPLLGIALQAEHDDPAQRARAPVLATFSGERLAVPCPEGTAGGYAGDIAAAPGGFLLSCQPAGKVLRWQADAPGRMDVVADLAQACALQSLDTPADGIALAAAAGVAWWHPSRPPAMLRWPQPMALDNHWAVLPRRP